MLQITTQRTTTPKAKPDESNLGFGVHYTDHMLIIDHDEEQGWHDARIVPYQPLELDPAAMVFHYAMESFEGLKAYRTPDGSIQLFRPDKNAQRMINTNHRMCLPSLPVEDFVQAVKAIVSFDQDWVPHAEGTSLYIRPFVIATEPHLGVRTSRTHKFIIVCSPVGAYYSTGINPVIADVMKASHDGKLEEVFGTGTAAVISPVGELRYEGDVAHINNGEIGEVTHKLYNTLTGIQWGKLPDELGWTVKVD